MASELEKATGRTAAAQAAAREAERSARDRETESKRRIQEAEKSTEEAVQRIRDEYEKQRADTINRNEEALQYERSQGYNRITDQKKRLSNELHRTQSEAENTLLQTKSHFDNEVQESESEAKQRLLQEQTRGKTELDQTKSQNRFAVDTENAKHLEQVRQLYQTQQSQNKNLNDQSKLQYEQTKTALTEANAKSTQQFQDSHKSLGDYHQRVLNELNSNANRQIKQIRTETAEKLDAYSSRQQDPFYKMADLGAQLTNSAEGYLVTAKVPPHEQEQVQVIARGNQIVISGTRRNEEKIEYGPGRQQGSSSYQSYTETFPIDWPVEHKEMQRKYDGETLSVWIPKKGINTGESVEKKLREKVQPKAATRPDFPKNLPLSPEYQADAAPGEPEAKKYPSRTGKTLG